VALGFLVDKSIGADVSQETLKQLDALSQGNLPAAVKAGLCSLIELLLSGVDNGGINRDTLKQQLSTSMDAVTDEIAKPVSKEQSNQFIVSFLAAENQKQWFTWDDTGWGQGDRLLFYRRKLLNINKFL